jgi:actin related protein 2/3 complex subunit 1A/1B
LLPGGSVPGAVDAREEKESKGKVSALDKFRNMDSRGSTAEEDLNTAVQSRHQNAIAGIAVFQGDGGRVQKFSTVGMDGKLIIWDMADVAKRGVNVA